MKRFHSFFTVLTVVLTLPGVAMAGGTCETLCSVTKDSVKNQIADPKCKANPGCMDCVANSVLGSQQGGQCQAYSSSKKGNTKQIISTSLYTITGIACGVACAVTMIPGYGTSQTETMSRICGGLGLVTAVSDIGFALTSNDIAGGLLGAIGGIGTASKNVQLVKNTAGALKTATETVGKNTLTEAGKKAKSNVCLNTAVYLGTAVMKGISLSKMSKATQQSCANVESLASGAGSAVQSCLPNSDPTKSITSSTLAGIFSPTPENFPLVSTSDITTNEAVAGATGEMMKAMKADLDAAAAAGVFNANDIAKRLAQGESVTDIAAGSGLPSQITDPLKEFEAKAKTGETSALFASLSGGYTGGGGSAVADSSATGNESFSFGNSGATPGEGADSLEIERKPAATDELAAVGSDGDVFHGAYAGTIFDIVTHRLKAQKGNYAELDPASRMNRLFNGLSDPNSNSARKPASDKAAK